jgi:hypothetical protein
MDSPSDAEVIGRSLDKPEAFGLVYDRHAATVLRFRTYSHVVCHAPLQEEPRPVHARLDGAQLEMQYLGDFGIREPFDIAQEKWRAVVHR